MAPLVAAIVAATAASTSAATSIATTILSRSGGPSDDQSSLVQGFCNSLWHQLAQCGRTDLTVVIYKSSIQPELVFNRGGYIGFVQLGSAGYNIFFVGSGYIKNNGARGFENWCVQGNQNQNDNVISFS